MPPATQQAWIAENQGHPKDVLKLKTDWPVSSKLDQGEVLVKVQAAALNPAGHKLMKMLPNFLAKRPIAPELDFAGIVEESNDPSVSQGDNVFGYIPNGPAIKQGALQQYVRSPASALVRRPQNITPIEASGIAAASLTAWQALFDHGKFEAGQTVFVNGGGTAVGAFAIQIAKAKGAARVVATASGRNEDFVRGLGVDEFIDYTQVGKLHEYLSANSPSPKFHLIIDAVGLVDLYTHSPAYLSPGGAFISVGSTITSLLPIAPVITTLWAWFCPVWLGGTPRRHKFMITNPSKTDLEAISQLIGEGKIKPIVDSVFEFSDVLAAYDRLMSLKTSGKVVIKVSL